jgi:hypothetical protein
MGDGDMYGQFRCFSRRTANRIVGVRVAEYVQSEVRVDAGVVGEVGTLGAPAWK